MTTSIANRLVETIERTRLAWPMAVLMAGAAAFLVYAAPAAIAEQAVAMTGIRALAVVAVPFGAAARGVLALGVAILSGSAIWWLFDRLDGGRQAVEADADPEIDLFAPDVAPAPQLRRADAHPDAPPRRPIFAASDLGAPMTDMVSGQTPFGRAPLFADDSGPVAAPASEASNEDDPDMLLLDERYGMSANMSGDAVEIRPAPPADPTPATAPSARESIAGLMARLERGLERRAGPAAVAPAPAPGDPGGLRQALDELRHMTIGR